MPRIVAIQRFRHPNSRGCHQTAHTTVRAAVEIHGHSYIVRRTRVRCTDPYLFYILTFQGTKVGPIPRFWNTKAYRSAVCSIAFVVLLAPCPDFVSMRINTGLSPACAA